MQVTVHETYTRAGNARLCGKGVALELRGLEYHLRAESMTSLFRGKVADLVNPDGEEEGRAWLSPISAPQKQEFVALIGPRLYVVGYRDFSRLLSGTRPVARVQEYHNPLPPGVF